MKIAQDEYLNTVGTPGDTLGHPKDSTNGSLLCTVLRKMCCPERDPQSVGAADPDGVEKVTASELAGADVEHTPFKEQTSTF